MTEPFGVGDRVSVLIALPGLPLGTPGTIITILPGQPAWCLVQPDDPTILPVVITSELLVRVASAA